MDLNFIRNPQMRDGFNGVFGGLDSEYKRTFYVDVNAGTTGGDGSSWGSAMKTLTVALAASKADIAASARGWAGRNRIFYQGDNDEAHKETLTTLADKTDIIGVGSYDHNAYPMLVGAHVIAGAFMGCRFINMGFKSLAAGGVIFTLVTAQSGIEFINCNFNGDSTVAGTIGLLATAVEQLKVSGCRFKGAFSTAAIQLGAGATNGLLIEKNLIQSAAKGIEISATLTAVYRDAIIKDNDFDVGTFVINDNAGGVVKAINNRGVTASNGSLDETWVVAAAKSNNNIITCAAGTQSIYPPIAAIPA